MAEQTYVLVKLEDYEEIIKIADERTLCLLRRLYGQLTGNCFIDKNDHWDIDPKGALEAAEELYDRLNSVGNVLYESGYPEPYTDLKYTKTEIELLNELLNENEDWD